MVYLAPALIVLLSLPQQHASAQPPAFLCWLIAPKPPACSELLAAWSVVLAMHLPCVARQLAAWRVEPVSKVAESDLFADATLKQRHVLDHHCSA